MDLYWRGNVFERFLSLYASGQLPVRLRKKILHLVFRASQVGGSTTLVTRGGILSWIEIQLALHDGNDVILRNLAEYLYEACDKEKVNVWSGIGVAQAIAVFVERGKY